MSIEVFIPNWTPPESFDWTTFFHLNVDDVIPTEPDQPVPDSPATLVPAPNDPESGWDPTKSVFITDSDGDVADFDVTYDAKGKPHYSIPDGTDQIQSDFLHIHFDDWLNL